MKRLFMIFFIIITFTGVFLLSSGCTERVEDNSTLIEAEENEEENEDTEQTSENTPNGDYTNDEQTNDEIIDDTSGELTDDEQNNEDAIDEQGDNEISNDQEVIKFLEAIYFPENIYLLNNGKEIPFIINFEPIDTTEEIYIEYVNENLIIFNEDGECEENFIYSPNKNYCILPLCAGETNLTISAKCNENEDITKICTIFVEDYEEFELHIFDTNNIEVNEFKSGQKADGSFEIYTALISSKKSLENRGLDFILSSNIILINGTQSSFEADEKYYYSFGFYLEQSGTHSMQASIQENYLNYLGNIFTQKIQMDSVDYIRELSAEVVRGNGEDVLTEDNTYLLYF
ncbi:MAG: hypothetical protein PHS54_04220, partial [Clostridia bacterium]|nr:hypothetical protein [Clostridia bacterium]